MTLPSVGGPIDGGGVYDTSAEALAAFLGDRDELLQDGYVEQNLADGSIGWVRSNEFGKVVTVVHAQPVEGGWTVDAWEASSC